MAVKYNFRILLETERGKQFSYYSSSFFNSDIDTGYHVSSSDVWGRITGSISCSFQNTFEFDDTVSNPYNALKYFKNDAYLSSSHHNSLNTGSIKFHYLPQYKMLTPVGGKSLDKIKRFKFFGSKVCNVLNIHENFWYRPTKFQIVSGSDNYFDGNVTGRSVSVVGNLNITNLARVVSDIPFKVDKKSSRYVKFVNTASNNHDLKLGYNDEDDTYELSADADSGVKFNIKGVNRIEASNYTYSASTNYITTSYSAGSTVFGDSNDDSHKFTGMLVISSSTMSNTPGARDRIRFHTTTLGDYWSMGLGNSGQFVWDYLYGTDTQVFTIWQNGLGVGIPSTVAVGTGYSLLTQNAISASGAIYGTDFYVNNAHLSSSYLTNSVTSSMGNLTVNGTGSFDRVMVNGDISASGNYYVESGNYIYFGGQDDQSITGNGATMWIDGDNYTNISSDNATNIVGGNVGIGIGLTQDPPKKLTVDGDISESGQIFVAESASIGTNTTSYLSGSQKGRFSIDYGDGSAMSGSITSVGDGYGDIVHIGKHNDGIAGTILSMWTDGTWNRLDCSDGLAASGSLLGVSLGGNTTTDGLLLRGFARVYGKGSFLIGQKVYLSTTAGQVTGSAPGDSGDVVRVLGYVISGSATAAGSDATQPTIYFNPDSTWIKRT